MAGTGSEVWVAAHTYLNTVESPTVQLEDGVAVYGGFAGTEIYREQRNRTTNVTTLDGDQLSSVVTIPSGATSATVIDGFVIRNGVGTWNGVGGGVYCASSVVVPTHVRANRLLSKRAKLLHQVAVRRKAKQAILPGLGANDGKLADEETMEIEGTTYHVHAIISKIWDEDWSLRDIVEWYNARWRRGGDPRHIRERPGRRELAVLEVWGERGVVGCGGSRSQSARLA